MPTESIQHKSIFIIIKYLSHNITYSEHFERTCQGPNKCLFFTDYQLQTNNGHNYIGHNMRTNIFIKLVNQ